MKITLDAQELNQAVLDYLTAQGLSIDTTKALVDITSEGVKIDTNPDTPNHETTQKTKTEKKAESKPTAKATPQKEPESTTTEEEPTQQSSVDKPVIADSHSNAEHEVSNSLFTDNKSESSSNAFAFKQSTSQDVRKLFS